MMKIPMLKKKLMSQNLLPLSPSHDTKSTMKLNLLPLSLSYDGKLS